MAGLDPAIHADRLARSAVARKCGRKDVDSRDKPGDDD